MDDQDKLLGLVAMGEEGQNLDYAIAADVIQSFLLQAKSLNTRSGTSEPKSPAAEFAVGRLRNGREVLRVPFAELTEYFISEAHGSIVAFVAEAGDGTELEAWKPNSFGGFAEWRISFPGGISVAGRGDGAIPDSFSSN